MSNSPLPFLSASLSRAIRYEMTTGKHLYIVQLALGLNDDMFKQKLSLKIHPVSTGLLRQILYAGSRMWNGTDLINFRGYSFQSELSWFPREYQEQIVFNIFNEGVNNVTIDTQTQAKLAGALANLEQALLTKDPLLSNHLRNTHEVLIAYPETVHLLTDSQIAMLITGMERHTQIEITKATTAKATTSRLKKAGLDDF